MKSGPNKAQRLRGSREQHLLNGHSTLLPGKQHMFSMVPGKQHTFSMVPGKQHMLSMVPVPLLPADVVYGNVTQLLIHGWLTLLARHYV